MKKVTLILVTITLLNILAVIFNSCKKEDAAIITLTGVSLDKTSANLTIGGTVQLTATITPSNSSNKSITWSTSDANKTSVSNSGLVTAIAAGAATITVTTSDGNKTASCTINISSPISIQSVSIPAGTFTMGSPDTEANRNSNETQYQVTLNAFRMSKHEITNAQFVSFLNAKRIRINEQYVTSSFGSQWLFYLSSGAIKYTTEWVVIAGYEAYPMINVTWYGAMEFAKFVGGRLPTEAEWEYAARAKTTQAFNTGDCLSNLNANYWWLYPQTGCTNNNSTFPYRPQPVGTYPPNAWGLYDMHGNVWEWCNDWFGTYPITSQTNPTGPNSGIARVYRGGDYLSYAQYCRSAYRSSTYPENSLSGSGLGFRVVFTP